MLQQHTAAAARVTARKSHMCHVPAVSFCVSQDVPVLRHHRHVHVPCVRDKTRISRAEEEER